MQLWRQHVLANLPMYSMLLPLYLDLARSRVSNRCEETLVDLKRVSRHLHIPCCGLHNGGMPSPRAKACHPECPCFVHGHLMDVTDKCQLTHKAALAIHPA